MGEMERNVRADGMKKKVDRDNEIDTPRDVANPRSSESGGRKRQALANKRNRKKTKIRM